MEWSWRQQVQLLLQSGGVGFILGFVYDVFRLPGERRRGWRFVLDMLFGVVAALITFYAALAMMDGRLHPLLFAGCGVGFWAQHNSVGRLHRRMLRRLAAGWRRFFLWWSAVGVALKKQMEKRIFEPFKRAVTALKTRKKPKSEIQTKKTQKKMAFFLKNP